MSVENDRISCDQIRVREKCVNQIEEISQEKMTIYLNQSNDFILMADVQRVKE